MASYNNRSLLLTALALAALSVLYSCKKDQVTEMATVQFEITHEVDGEGLVMDTIRYENMAGNPFSVSRLEYYLSNFTFLSDDSEEEVIDEIFYVNPNKPNTLVIENQELAAGTYQTLQFHVGLPAEENTSYNLPGTPENVNMAWPEQMGGGYHFMKLEGHFIDAQTNEKGYAMHLGMNQWLVTVTLNNTLQVAGDDNQLRLTMNLNEWFENPHTYDFNVQGNYSMGVDSLMSKLSENGLSSFSLTQIN